MNALKPQKVFICNSTRTIFPSQWSGSAVARVQFKRFAHNYTFHPGLRVVTSIGLITVSNYGRCSPAVPVRSPGHFLCGENLIFLTRGRIYGGHFWRKVDCWKDVGKIKAPPGGSFNLLPRRERTCSSAPICLAQVAFNNSHMGDHVPPVCFAELALREASLHQYIWH